MQFLKTYQFWIITFALALALRLIFATFFYHTDVKHYYRNAISLDKGISLAYEEGYSKKDPLTYPPPTYLFFNIYNKLTKPLLSSDFDSWIKDFTTGHILYHQGIFQDMLVMKLPIILFDLLIAVLLIKLAPAGKKRVAGALWLFNPFSIYATYQFSEFDVIPTFFVLASFYLFSIKKYSLPYFTLALGASFKLFPLFILPFWLLLDPRSLKQKLLGLFIFLISFLVLISPIFLSVPSLKSVFLSSMASGAFQAVLELGSQKVLSIYLVLLSGLFIARALGYLKQLTIPSVIFLIFGSLFALSHFHPQWMIWIMPFLILMLVKGEIGAKEVLILMLTYFVGSLLINDKFMSLGSLKAVNDAFDSIEPTRFFLDQAGLGTQLQGVASALFLSLTVIISLQALGYLKVNNFLNLRSFSLSKITLGWVLAILLVFLLVHIPLTLKGRYIDTVYSSENLLIPLTSQTEIAQKIKVNTNNLNIISLRLKNIGLRNKENVEFKLLDEQENTVRELVINGGSIGDDFDLNLTFPAIADSAGKIYTLTLKSPSTKEELEIVVPYDGYSGFTGLVVNNQEIEGRLSYTLFSKPGSYSDNLLYSLNNIKLKLGF